MIKKFNEFMKTQKINEDVELEVQPSISAEDLVRQLSDRLGIDISSYDIDDICNNINVDGLSMKESVKVVKNYLKSLNS
jgi:predicted metalloenzyme YecM